MLTQTRAYGVDSTVGLARSITYVLMWKVADEV